LSNIKILQYSASDLRGPFIVITTHSTLDETVLSIRSQIYQQFTVHKLENRCYYFFRTPTFELVNIW